MNWQEFLKNKNVTQLGLGLLGRGVQDANFLSDYVNHLTITDKKTEAELSSSIARLKNKNISLHLGNHFEEDFVNKDFILKSAGVPLDSPFVKKAIQNNIPVYMDESLFEILAPKHITVGITGTRGKTTTTLMIHHALIKLTKNNKVYLGGNIKEVATLPFLETFKEGDILVSELSSWQLQGFRDIKNSPHIAVFTTFYEDHLNYYAGDMQKYLEDKMAICEFQTEKDFFIISSQAYEEIKKYNIILPKSKIIVVSDLSQNPTKLLGKHNQINTSLAIEVLKVLGYKQQEIESVIADFEPPSGRLQTIGQKNGAIFINDATSTTPEAVIAALRATSEMNKPIILIMGGADKKIHWQDSVLREVEELASYILLVPGSGTELIKDRITYYKDFLSTPKALEYVKDNLSWQNSIVLCSPGFASFGEFVNEFNREDTINNTINKLFLND